MNLTASDIDTITMYRFEPVRGSDDYKYGMDRVCMYIGSRDCYEVLIESNKEMRKICTQMKIAPI